VHELGRIAAGQAPDWKGTARFEVVRSLGRGGMGAVYEAIDRERRQRVAVKTLLRFDPTALYLFKQEFRTLAGVSHANLVRLYELLSGGEGDSLFFFSMELVRGIDFVKYVHGGADRRSGAPHLLGARRTTPADPDRLLSALKQLVAGVEALHAAGKLHRDIKPPNVLVTDEGRVVLLDFGVATDVRRSARDGSGGGGEDDEVVGTAIYMAPEQALEGAPTPAADWYSVGAMLYEALVGAPPFGGTAMDVILAKNGGDPAAPSELVDGVPDRLDELCRGLLSRNPEERPTGAEIRRLLGEGRISVRAPPLSRRGPSAGGLVGRGPQMNALADAFETARAARSVTVRVAGPAGMGKSALVQHFLDRVSEEGHAVVLRGRAYERESLAYKAVDSVIDALTRHLVVTADDEERPLPLPAGIGALAHLFPVLRRVPSIAVVPEERVADPARTRRLAFAALRELFGTLARRSDMVVFVDDAQWGDTDSAALLLELVRPPNAPPILLLLGYREEDSATPFLAELRARWPAGADVRDVAVGPLDAEGATALASSLIGPGALHDKLADAVAREAAGSPFLIEELTRESASRLLATEARVTIDDVVADRLAQLPDDARRLVEIVAVGGRPLPIAMLGDAAEVASVDDLVALLASRRFVRSGLRDGREVAEPIHERIRETIVAQLAPGAIREHHRRIARVLEAMPSSDPESVAVHLLGAGESERGGRFAEKAAEQAAKLLAFDQAARLFRLAIETSTDAPRLVELYARLGEVLGWAGRNEEAGRAYIAAAERATLAGRSKLERAAAGQLLAAGRLDEGGMMLRRVLAGAGVDTPQSPFATMASLMAYKARLRVFGMKFEAKDAKQVSAAAAGRMDAMHVAALGLASVDVHLAACMQARQLYEALRAGDRTRVVRAATLYYGSHLATRGGPVTAHERAVQALIDRLVEQGGSAEERAFSRGRNGVGLFLRGHWRAATEAIDTALAILPEHQQQQQAGMRAQWALYAAYSQVFLGDLVELRRRKTRLLADAEERGDLLMTVLFQISHPIVLLLAADDPDGARKQIREAKERWSHGKYLIQDWQAMRSEVETELYAGNGVAAYDRIERDVQELDKSMLLRVQLMRALNAYARGRAAVASAAEAPDRRRARLSEARKAARALRRENMVWCEPLGALVAASAHSVEGNRGAAAASLREAITVSEAADMVLYAAAARHQLGLLLGGIEGSALLRQAEAPMRAQDIEVPSRFASMLAPGRWTAGA
jgi:hypothetical protein